MMRKMRQHTALLVATAGCALGAPAAAAEFTLVDYETMKARMEASSFAGRAEWNALSFYLQGAMETIGSIQKDAERTGGDKIFCPPTGETMDMGDVFAILDDARRETKKQPAIAVLLAGIHQRYPCKK